MQALKQRVEFEGENAIKNLILKITRLNGRLATTKRDIKNTLLLLTKNPEGPSAKIYQEQLDDLGLRREEIEDEIQFCKNERNRLKDQQLLDDESYKSILNEFISIWNESSKTERENLIRTLVRSVNSTVDTSISGSIEICYIADKKLESDWSEIKNANSDEIKVRTSCISGFPDKTHMHFFRVIWPIDIINKGLDGVCLDLDSQKFAKIHPFLKGANYRLTEKSVNSTKKKKVKKSRREQAIRYRKLLKTGKVKNRAELARNFGVSRAWITKVLS